MAPETSKPSQRELTPDFLKFGEAQLDTIERITSSMYASAKSSHLMSIVSALYTVDVFSKLGFMYPASAQIVREGIIQALSLQFRSQDLENQRAWENIIPLLGFLEPSAKISVESILDTSVTVDATGGEEVAKAIVGAIAGLKEEAIKAAEAGA